ncbi:molybdopterin-dependent oxidoreductase [Lagierella sp.]|uniref:molybdopterin-dependent oxidoreductase n=1 Tax=Lagierella sp. TaxID=2849657 RepID=UPI00260DDC37|nr:molybdopterin-dependent oxidoreductase [Lagierella sp.]
MKITRKTFLKLSSALALFGLTACSERFEKVKKENIQKETYNKGKWIPAPCWDNCGGKCVLNAFVNDDKVLKLKTDDSHEDSLDYPQQRACARGRAQRQRVYGIDRLKYPMKRVNWSLDNPNGELRGKDQWERISWDEALDYIAEGTKKIVSKYGNEAIYVLDGGETARTFAAYGGYIAKYGSRSRGAWKKSMKPIFGIDQKQHCMNDRFDILKSKLIVLWGNNPATTQIGGQVNNILRAKELGIPVIVVDPMYTQTAEMIADKYIPIRPTTDTPLILAVCYVMLKEDSQDNNYVDWDFIHRCTIGFDEETMPEGADKKENFKDYVLGTYDGIPKTPEWASKICGTSVEDIYYLARELGSKKPATIYFGWGSARIEKGTHVCLAIASLMAITGNTGVEGGAVAVSNQELSTNGGPYLVKPGDFEFPEIENPIKKKLCTNEHWKAILDGEFTAGVNKKEPLDIHMIYHSHCAALSQTPDTNMGIKAHRKVDLVVTHQHYFDTNARYSDIVLPVTTPWEREGHIMKGNRETLIWTKQVTKPIFETKDDIWIAIELAKRLGIDEKLIAPVDESQRLFNIIQGAQVIKEDGSVYENLVSITQEDLNELGVKGNVQNGRVPILKLREDGIYQVKRSENDKLGYIHHKKFRENPEENPIDTESGKIELYCKTLADQVTKAGWNEGVPIAKYEPASEGYEATFKDFERQIKGKYPLQICGLHQQRYTHSLVGNVKWLEFTFPYNAYVNPQDARERNLKMGDAVRIFNDNGSIVRKVLLTERAQPGVVYIMEGPAVEFDDEGNCITGQPNILTGTYPSGPDIEAFQTCIGQMEKYDNKVLDDYERPSKVFF